MNNIIISKTNTNTNENTISNENENTLNVKFEKIIMNESINVKNNNKVKE